ncbi:dihydrodipicolinate reductase signature [Lucifera butyrica]|uniref:4-hydroxy-tetrahydrodipicolinate reductase n=1 Tax=Lucifera butyrica TaxID=1351585 RepID=A0A498R2A1_9FIRM|nr:4-hydroxy-tetrahydrodipicolinate reductase [Lucifera butyrica]VBB06756.1 dihydrodipicolinate reductase signature [Lucifera butyrica]
MKIALVGLGRTGKIVAEYLWQKKVLNMVLCRPESSKAHKDLGEILNCKDTGILVETSDHLERKLFQNQPDVLIDFSSSNFLKDNIHALAKSGTNVVTAVTGYEPAEVEKIRNFAEKGNIGVIMAPNITYGVNVLMLMAEIVAELMSDYDFEVLEEHHKHKQDRPSGTAKKIADKIRVKLMNNQEVPAQAVRAGGIIGKHKVLVCGEFDKIEISHESFSRVAFAQGAYKAAQFITGKTGFYEMTDIFEQERQERQKQVSASYDEKHAEELDLA